MDKIPQLLSQSANHSELELPRFSPHVLNQKNINHSKHNCVSREKNMEAKKSFAVFQYLIFTTTIVFAFGGLGFGFALRCGNDLQASQSAMNQTHIDK